MISWSLSDENVSHYHRRQSRNVYWRINYLHPLTHWTPCLFHYNLCCFVESISVTSLFAHFCRSFGISLVVNRLKTNQKWKINSLQICFNDVGFLHRAYFFSPLEISPYMELNKYEQSLEWTIQLSEVSDIGLSNTDNNALFSLILKYCKTSPRHALSVYSRGAYGGM